MENVTFTRMGLIALLCMLLLAPAGSAAEQDSLEGKDFLPRLFVAPAGRVLPSGIVNAAFGGSFASQGGREYLGLFSIGLGGIAEFEFSTAHLITNVFNFAEPIGTTALKVKLYNGKPNSFIPSVVAGLRSNQWSEANNDERDELDGPAIPGREDGREIYNVEFETHLTNLFLVTTFDFSDRWILHLGGTWNESKIRGLEVNSNERLAEGEEQTDATISGHAAIEHLVNDRTHSMVEIGTTPQLKFDDQIANAELEPVWYTMMGVRYFITRLTSFDAGIRYRSNYSGLADAEIRAGLNVGVDVGKEVMDKFRDKK